MMFEDGWGEGDYGGGYGDGNGDGYGYGTATNGGGRGIGYRTISNYGYGDGDVTIEENENPHCTRTCNGDVRFLICQQTMVGYDAERRYWRQPKQHHKISPSDGQRTW